MIDAKQIRHIAKLARLGLDDKESEKFAGQLSEILAHMEMLNEVDTANVEPTSQVTGLMNVTRPDRVEKSCGREKLLGCTGLPVEKEQIRVKSVITY